MKYKYAMYLNINLCKTLGRCPNTPQAFEKAWPKLLVKYRDRSRYFGTKYKIADNKPSLKGKVSNRRFDGRVLKPSPQEKVASVASRMREK